MFCLSRICDLNTCGYDRLQHLSSGVIFAQARCLHSQNNPKVFHVPHICFMVMKRITERLGSWESFYRNVGYARSDKSNTIVNWITISWWMYFITCKFEQSIITWEKYRGVYVCFKLLSPKTTNGQICKKPPGDEHAFQICFNLK